LRRFFVQEIQAKEGFCSITGSEAKHISQVLRMERGDRIVLMDDRGKRYQASIDGIGAREVRVRLEKELPKPRPSPVEIILCQALLKSGPMDLVIQKTSELGVDCIAPFSSKRTVVRLEGDRLTNKIRHWREIAQSAATQSDRDMPARIENLRSFREVTALWAEVDALKVILWEQEDRRALKDVLRLSPIAGTFVGVVGPEGGFGQEEIEEAREAGFVSVSVGNRVLRSETAALTLAALVQYEWGDLRPREPL
jgi:16S rRNA (uracil1498-N3)-methyltransferase